MCAYIFSELNLLHYLNCLFYTYGRYFQHSEINCIEYEAPFDVYYYSYPITATICVTLNNVR